MKWQQCWEDGWTFRNTNLLCLAYKGKSKCEGVGEGKGEGVGGFKGERESEWE